MTGERLTKEFLSRETKTDISQLTEYLGPKETEKQL